MFKHFSTLFRIWGLSSKNTHKSGDTRHNHSVHLVQNSLLSKLWEGLLYNLFVRLFFSLVFYFKSNSSHTSFVECNNIRHWHDDMKYPRIPSRHTYVTDYMHMQSSVRALASIVYAIKSMLLVINVLYKCCKTIIA